MLYTKYDIELFVIESSPHIKNVSVSNNEDGDFVVDIKLYFFYGFFYSSSYYEFIMKRFEENLMSGVDCYITVR